MDNFKYGFAMTLVGMGGTLLTLYTIVLLVDMMRRLFPYREEEQKAPEVA